MTGIHIKITIYALAATFFSLFGITSCSAPSQWHRAEGAAWGTSYHITYYGNRVLDDSVVAVMRDVELSLSPFEHSSLISRINRGETDSTDHNIRCVFDRAVDIWRASGGAFDPTVAPLVNLWGFGYIDEKGETPDSAAIADALQYVGMGKCRIERGRIIKAHPKTTFDFSAITKGYGVDCVARMLERNGVTDYIVEIGGEVVCRGHNPRGKIWQVQIDAPVADSIVTHRQYEIFPLEDAAMATSGNYRNFRVLDNGKRIGHTISPLTGYPRTTTTLSASVIAPDCISADALATACMTMDADDAIAMIRALGKGYSVILIIDTPDGEKSLRS